jgi:hydroxymethylpyrimidine pyrophosphatase-like HAD family hydrolase
VRGLFATDLDGTLIDAERRVPERNRAAIARAHEQGVAVAIVTGRRQSTIHAEHAKLSGLSYRVAASNGSVVLAPDNLSFERVRALDWALIDSLAEVTELGAAPLVCITTGDEPALPPDSAPDCFVLEGHTRRWMRTWRWSEPSAWEPSERDEAQSQRLVHVALHLPSREQALELEGLVAALAPEEAEVHVVIAPYSVGGLIEVVPRGGKAWALEYFAESLGVPAGATAAVGDELNDAAMLDAAAHPFTVGGSVLARSRPHATEVGDAASGSVADAIDLFLERLT